MRFIMFTKMLQKKSIDELIALAKEWGLDGYDLCVRPDYPVSPENALEEMPKAVAKMREAGLWIPMVTAPGDWTSPDMQYVPEVLEAMDKADVRLLKLGYFRYMAETDDYQEKLLDCRETLRSWAPLARKHHIRILYHTHSNSYMGLNGASLAHLLEGMDPSVFGAYLDAGHMRAEGEDFTRAYGMLTPWLQAISVKDVRLDRVEVNGHGKVQNFWTTAGNGCVDWTAVFTWLHKKNWDKPISIHCEFKCEPQDFEENARKEVAFFRRMDEMTAESAQ